MTLYLYNVIIFSKIARVKGKRAFPHLISLSGDIDGGTLYVHALAQCSLFTDDIVWIFTQCMYAGLLAYLCDAYTESNRTTELKALPVRQLKI